MTGDDKPKRRGPNQPPLSLDMNPDEALRRFLGTDPDEARELAERTRTKKKGGAEAPPDDAGNGD